MGKVGGYIDGGIDGKHVLQAEGGGISHSSTPETGELISHFISF